MINNSTNSKVSVSASRIKWFGESGQEYEHELPNRSVQCVRLSPPDSRSGTERGDE